MPPVEHREATAASSSDAPARTTTDLVPFVPRLTLEWLRGHPEVNWLEIEGTLAFIDISGFTTMSERLSSRGRAGAEEVTEVMNATFAALLAVAYAGGGGLLKFGGDALLLLYEGEDHAGRAARAAFDMRRTLRAIGRPRTSAGAVQLKMHAGLHAGRFQFFLVGESHRELLVTGPAASRTVEMEAASEAGEILLSPETADLLGIETLGEEKGPGRLLRAAPDAPRHEAPLPVVDGIPLEVAVPAPLRAQLLQVGPLEGEHRNAAIAFIRFTGIDNVIATEGPEAAAEALDVLVRTVQSAADDHKVTFLESDVDRDGGRIVLVSGAPQTFGDDEERLLRTVRAVVNAGLPLPVHVGVNQGRVFTGQVGAPFRRTYTVLGDTAALAARLMARAKEDEIWVAKNAFARGGARFDAVELEPFHVKGKSEPVRAVMLGELGAETARPEADAEEKLPFVDRERERAVLAASVAPVRMGFGTFVELVGEPGIGKSRLAEELRENCSDMQYVTMRCEQYESSTPYYPFRPFLRSLLDVELNGGGEHNRAVLSERLGTLDGELAPWAPLLAAPLDVEVEATPEVDDLDPAFWRARLHGVMGNVLGQLLDSPTLMVFEDVHWMDDASSELLRYLGTQLSARPWLTCTTRRPVEGGFAAADGTPPLPALTLRLEPLPAEDAKELVQAAAGGRRLTDEELAALMERGAGNPLFLQELASPEESAAGEGEKLPETVEALVATRIDRLAPGDRALLRWASVIGVSFPGAVIADVLEGDPTAASDSEAWDRLAEFVERDPEVPGAFRFRHALIRDAAYEGLSYKRRRELHGRVAEVIERRHGKRPEDAAEILSLHFYRAERWTETWRYSVVAGRRAEEKYANVEATQFFERTLEVVRRVPEMPAEGVARIWEALGDARMRLGEYERAGIAYRESRAASPGDAVEEARLMAKEALGAQRLARFPLALRRLTKALGMIEGIEGDAATGQRARLYSAYGTVLQHQRRPLQAVEWCKKAIAEAGDLPKSRDALADAYRIMDWAYLTLGRLEEAVYSQRATEIYEELGDLNRLAWVLNIRGAVAFLSGRWDETLQHTAAARDAWRKTGDETSSTVAEFNRALILVSQGRIEEAEAPLRAVIEIQNAAGNQVDIAQTRSLLGMLEAHAGRHEAARELFEGSRALSEQEGDELETLLADARCVDSLVLQGDSSAALELSAEALVRSESLEGVSMQVMMLRRLRGWAFMQAGDLDAAHEELRESIRISALDVANFGMESPDYEIALTLDALVQLGRLRGEPMDDSERERDVIFERLGVVWRPEPPLEPAVAESSSA